MLGLLAGWYLTYILSFYPKAVSLSNILPKMSLEFLQNSSFLKKRSVQEV